jgi:hypothetical protein
MPRGRHASSGHIDEDIPAPLATLVNVMDYFFDAYAVCRNSGEDQRVAVRLALAEVVPGDMQTEVIAMLSGQIDRKISETVGEPFDGQQLCSDLIEEANEYWELREGNCPVSSGTAVVRRQGPTGEWDGPSEAHSPAAAVEEQVPWNATAAGSRVDQKGPIERTPRFDGVVAREPSSAPEQHQWARCEACGRGPALEIKLRSTGGYVVYRTLKSSRPLTLCKRCGLEALHRSQKIAGVGVATLNLFAPYALAQNQKWILRLKQLPDPT